MARPTTPPPDPAAAAYLCPECGRRLYIAPGAAAPTRCAKCDLRRLGSRPGLNPPRRRPLPGQRELF